jgi:glutathione-independent formaldehyde dehydrogenase
MGTSQCPVKRYNRHLRNLIHAGKAQPSFIVSHHLRLDQAPEGYEHFDRRDDGWTKVLLHPNGTSSADPPRVVGQRFMTGRTARF